MLISEQVMQTLHLLNVSQKKKYWLMVSMQIFVNIFDLIAILMLTLFGICASAIAGLTSMSSSFEDITKALMGEKLTLEELTITLGLITAFVLVGKSALSMLALKKTFSFLARASVSSSTHLLQFFLESTFFVRNKFASQNVSFAISRGLNISEILGSFSIIVSESFSVLILSTVLIIVNPFSSTLVITYLLILGYLMQKIVSPWVRSNSRKLALSEIDSDRYVQEILGIQRELLVSNSRYYFVNKVEHARRIASNAHSNIQLNSYIPKYLSESALILGAILVWMGNGLVMQRENWLVEMLVFLMAGMRILPSLLRIQSAANVISAISGSNKVSQDLISELNKYGDLNVATRDMLKDFLEFTPRIQIRNLTFGYHKESNFRLQDINLEINPNSFVALAGPSGSGKSTMLDLIIGNIEPESGEILISGTNPKVAFEVWPTMVSYVPQEIRFISGSLRENILLGSSSIDDDFLWSCLENVKMLDHFKATADGLDTFLSEGGLNLSGGQRQRLGIARALYRQPQILILDEVTSALDSETEQAISDVINGLKGNITIIAVAHRLSTVKMADKVVYIDDGSILCEGTFKEVARKIKRFEVSANLYGINT